MTDFSSALLLLALAVGALAWAIPAGRRIRAEEWEYRRERDAAVARLDAALIEIQKKRGER